jgi:transcription antitermination factor NusG
MEKRNWYAIYTRSRSEKKTAEAMQNNGYHVYLPLIKTLRQWSDRKKWVEIPLISSYIFVNVTEREYYAILDTPGVVCYVTFEGKAAPIRNSDIEALKMAINKNIPIELIAKPLKKGQKVKIIAGPMKGAEGEYVSTNHKTNFIINIRQIGFLLKVEIHDNHVVKI